MANGVDPDHTALQEQYDLIWIFAENLGSFTVVGFKMLLKLRSSVCLASVVSLLIQPRARENLLSTS